MAVESMYEKLWHEALAALDKGEPQLDAHLPDKARDFRRGISVALRPAAAVQRRLKRFTDELTTICPGQYHYQPEEWHVTLISLVSGTEAWRPEMRRLGAYRAIVRDVLSRQSAFNIVFRGVTASPAAVMIQGFPVNDALNQIREALRAAFLAQGFGHVLDRRYKICTAHMTVLRFQNPSSNWQELVKLLQENRATDFGETEVDRLQLLWGDWFASSNIVRRLEEYRLPKALAVP